MWVGILFLSRDLVECIVLDWYNYKYLKILNCFVFFYFILDFEINLI